MLTNTITLNVCLRRLIFWKYLIKKLKLNTPVKISSAFSFANEGLI